MSKKNLDYLIEKTIAELVELNPRRCRQELSGILDLAHKLYDDDKEKYKDWIFEWCFGRTIVFSEVLDDDTEKCEDFVIFIIDDFGDIVMEEFIDDEDVFLDSFSVALGINLGIDLTIEDEEDIDDEEDEQL